jgi:hypothetical protein
LDVAAIRPRPWQFIRVQSVRTDPIPLMADAQDILRAELRWAEQYVVDELAAICAGRVERINARNRKIAALRSRMPLVVPGQALAGSDADRDAPTPAIQERIGDQKTAGDWRQGDGPLRCSGRRRPNRPWHP